MMKILYVVYYALAFPIYAFLVVKMLVSWGFIIFDFNAKSGNIIDFALFLINCILVVLITGIPFGVIGELLKNDKDK